MPGKKVKIGYTVEVVRLQNVPKELVGDGVTVHWKKKSKKSKKAGLSKGQAGRTVPVVVHSSSVVFDKVEDQSEFVVESHVLKDMASMKLSPSKKLLLAVQVERIEPLDNEKEKKKSKKKEKKAANSKLELGSLEIDLNAHAGDGQTYRLDGMLLHDMPNFLAASRTTIDIIIRTRWLKFDGMRCVMAQPVAEEAPPSQLPTRKKASQRQSVVGAQWTNLISNVGHLTKSAKPQVVPDGSPARNEKHETATVDGMEYELADTETDVSLDDTSYMDGTFTASEMDFTADDLSDDEADLEDFPDDADMAADKDVGAEKAAADAPQAASSSSKRKKLRRLSQRMGSTLRESMLRKAKPARLAASFTVEIIEANELPSNLDGSNVYVSWKRGSEAGNAGQSALRKAGLVADDSVAVSWMGASDEEAQMKFQCTLAMDPRTETYKEKLLAVQIRKKRKERRESSSTPGKSSSGSAVAHTSVNLVEWLDAGETAGEGKDVTLLLDVLRSKKSKTGGEDAGEPKQVSLKLRVTCIQTESKEAAAATEGEMAPTTTTGRVFGRPLDDVLGDDLPGSHVPTLVSSITAAVRATALSRQGLFRISGSGRVVQRIIQHFDFTEPTQEPEDLTAYGPHELCDVLKKFVRQLPEPLVSASLLSQFMEVGETLVQAGAEAARMERPEVTDRLAALVQQLPVSRFALLEHLLEFLLEVSEHAEENKMTVANLATVWGPTALPTDDVDPMAMLAQNPRKVAVFAYLLSFWSAIVHTEVAPKSSMGNDTPSLDALIELLGTEDEEDHALEEATGEGGEDADPGGADDVDGVDAETDVKERENEEEKEEEEDEEGEEDEDEEGEEDEEEDQVEEEEEEGEKDTIVNENDGQETDVAMEAEPRGDEEEERELTADGETGLTEKEEEMTELREEANTEAREEESEKGQAATAEQGIEQMAVQPEAEPTDIAVGDPAEKEDDSHSAAKAEEVARQAREAERSRAEEAEWQRKDEEKARKLAAAAAELKQLKSDMRALKKANKAKKAAARADARAVEEERRTERTKRQAERAQEQRRLRAASEREKARRAAEKELLVKMKAEMEEQAKEKEQADTRVEQLRYQLARSEEKAAALKAAARAQLNEEALNAFLVEHIYLSTRAWDEEEQQPKTVTILTDALWPRLVRVDADSCRASASALREVLEAMRKAHKRTRDGMEWNCYWLSCLTYLLQRMQQERDGLLLFSSDVRDEGLPVERMADISPLWEIAPAASLLSATHVEEQMQLLAVYFFIYLLDCAMGAMRPFVNVFLDDPQGRDAKDDIIDPLTSRLDQVLDGLSVHKLLPSVTRQLVHSLFSSIAVRLLQKFREEPNLCTSQTGISIKLNLCSLNYWIDAHPSPAAKDSLRAAMTAMEPVEQAANLLVTCTNTALFSSGEELCESFPALAADNVQFILQNFIPDGLTREERDKYDAVTTGLILDLHSVVEAEQRAMAAAASAEAEAVDDAMLLLSDSEEELISGLTSDLE